MADAANTGARAVLEQLKTLWGKQSKGRRTLAVLALVGVIGVVAVTKIMGSTSGYTVVIEGGSPDDAQDLLAALSASGISARLHDGKVEVPNDRVDEARAAAASAGLPHTGKGFELFDKADLGESSFDGQVKYNRALGGELQRSIASLAQVQSARVHLSMGKRSVFKENDEPPSASVALHLHPGQMLTGDQVRGVRELVAAGIPGLKPEAVVIVDNHGNPLEGADPTNADKKAEIERTKTARVRSMLERVVGAGKVSVVTTAVIDDSEVSETQELYDADKPAVRSESRTSDGTDPAANIGGVAGTRGNLPGAPAAGPAPGSPPSGHVQETKNYELSRTVRQTKKVDPLLQRLYLAIVVDEKVGADGKPVPRTKEELAELTAIARQAAGIDDSRGDKIELHSIRFAPDETVAAVVPPASLLPVPMPVAIGGGAGVLVLLAVIVLMLKRGKKKKSAKTDVPMTLALPAPVADLERVLEAREVNAELPGIRDVPALPAGMPVRDRVISIVKNDVERTAEVLTAWLSEPPPLAAKGAKS